jgi:hypothetical protein
MEEIQNSLVDKLQMMRDSTLKKMGNQRAQMKDSSFAEQIKRY